MFYFAFWNPIVALFCFFVTVKVMVGFGEKVTFFCRYILFLFMMVSICH